jgi:23S rRNA (pseudouridine1915-N3)-methyltransferase
MRIVIAAVGRMRPGPARLLLDTYLGRMTALAVDVREVVPRGNLPAHKLKAAEAGLLLHALPESGPIIAMDERGDDLSSQDFTALLAEWRDQGHQDCGFVIGGADGLDDSVRQRAAKTLRFGRATWPHMVVRVMLAEQLYRAQQIMAGHPYHRE